MNDFLHSNDWQWRLARTVVQGVMGVLVANMDLIFGQCLVDPAWRGLAAAIVMAVLSPIMAEMGGEL